MPCECGEPLLNIMQKDSIAQAAKVFLFHLNNSNDENGILAHEGWKLHQVNEAEKTKIEHEYYPTVSVEVDSKFINDFCDSVLTNMKAYAKIKLTDALIRESAGSSYLIAFSPARIRR